jgi:hypothetical protein
MGTDENQLAEEINTETDSISWGDEKTPPPEPGP